MLNLVSCDSSFFYRFFYLYVSFLSLSLSLTLSLSLSLFTHIPFLTFQRFIVYFALFTPRVCLLVHERIRKKKNKRERERGLSQSKIGYYRYLPYSYPRTNTLFEYFIRSFDRSNYRADLCHPRALIWSRGVDEREVHLPPVEGETAGGRGRQGGEHDAPGCCRHRHRHRRWWCKQTVQRALCTKM